MTRALLLLDELEHIEDGPRVTVRAKTPGKQYNRFRNLDFNEKAYGGIVKSKRFAKLDFYEGNAWIKKAKVLRHSAKATKRFKAIAKDVFAEEVAEEERKRRARHAAWRQGRQWVDTSNTASTTDVVWITYGSMGTTAASDPWVITWNTDNTSSNW
jgi:hypothetical protein